MYTQSPPPMFPIFFHHKTDSHGLCVQRLTINFSVVSLGTTRGQQSLRDEELMNSSRKTKGAKKSTPWVVI